MYLIGDTCIWVERHVFDWRYMYLIGDTCIWLEIPVFLDWRYMYAVNENVLCLWISVVVISDVSPVQLTTWLTSEFVPQVIVSRWTVVCKDPVGLVLLPLTPSYYLSYSSRTWPPSFCGGGQLKLGSRLRLNFFLLTCTNIHIGVSDRTVRSHTMYLYGPCYYSHMYLVYWINQYYCDWVAQSNSRECHSRARVRFPVSSVINSNTGVILSLCNLHYETLAN